MFVFTKVPEKEIESVTKIGVRGRFTLQAKNRLGRVTRERAFDNLLTDLGLDALGVDGARFLYAHVGTGTSAPTAADTSLGNFGVGFSASSEVGYGNSGSSPYIAWCRQSGTSAVGGATGTWTEVGMSRQAADGGLRSRALILDGDDNPSSFPVLSDESLTVTYEMQIMLPETPAKKEILLSGTPYDTTTQLGGINRNDWAPRKLTSTNSWNWEPSNATFPSAAYSASPSGLTSISGGGSNMGGSSSISAAAYSTGNYHRDISATWNPGVATGVIKCVRIGLRHGLLFCIYDDTITKGVDDRLTQNIRISWARA